MCFPQDTAGTERARENEGDMERFASRRTLQGQRGPVRIKETWSRTVEKDLRTRGRSLGTAP